MWEMWTLGMIAIGFVAACGGSGDDAGGGGGDCTAWRTNSAEDAMALQGQVHAIGSVSEAGGTVTVHVDGSVPNEHAINGWDNAALYAKGGLRGDFDARVHVDMAQSSTDQLRAFFAVQAGLHGARVNVTHANGGSSTHVYLMGGGAIETGAVPAGADLSMLRIVRTGGMLYAGIGAADYTTFDHVAADDVELLVAIGVAAENYPGGAVTGTADAVFSGLVVTAADGGDCFAGGLQQVSASASQR